MSLRARIHTSAIPVFALLAAAAVAVAAAVALLLAFPAAHASGSQLGMFEDDVALFANPAATLQNLRQLGVGVVRVAVRWSEVSPAAGSASPPRGFNPADPASYPAGTWNRFDTVVRDARANGIRVLFVLSGPAPRWATGSDRPARGTYLQWKPSPLLYGEFVHAVALRYNGRYPDPHAGTRDAVKGATLPRLSMWEIWNEPNWGQDLAPQTPIGSSALASPAIYRGLLNAGWRALQTNHAHDTVLVGSLSPRGWPKPGYTLASKPMIFVRSLYCVTKSYRQLRGRAAAASGCPTTSAASRGFRAANPGLFRASGFGVHPYPFFLPPTRADSPDPNFVEFNEIPRLVSALDRLQRIYGSSRRLQIYNTEYGYETNPPNRSQPFVSPATAGYYINWAEYLSWRNRRIASTMQYLLRDPNPSQGRANFGYGGFAAGLVFYNGKPKADYYAYRMPVYLPASTVRRRRAVEVWGCVRPAIFAPGVRRGQIQFQRRGRGPFRTVSTFTVRDPHGYFDVRVRLPASGTVRVAWRTPQNAWIYSRGAAIAIR